MRHIEVVAAIVHDEQGRILATQRGYGDMRGGWEFPGGKVEPGETHVAALQRELHEELAIAVAVGDRVATVEWDYPAFHLTMHCYHCRLASGQPTLREHLAARWLLPHELLTPDWLPPDRVVADLLAGA